MKYIYYNSKYNKEFQTTDDKTTLAECRLRCTLEGTKCRAFGYDETTNICYLKVRFIVLPNTQ